MKPPGLWARLVRGVCRARCRTDWQALAGPEWAECVMTQPVTDHFHAKQGRSTGRLVLETEERRLVVYLKRHYHLPWWRRLLALLWPERDWSPALGEWKHLEWARREGFPVPATVAAAEFIGPWGRMESVLAVEELPGMMPLHEAIPLAAQRLSPASFRHWKKGMVKELARLAVELHQRRWFHKDMYLCHFYVPAEDTYGLPAGAEWRDRIHMIDLHRLARHRWIGVRWRIKDLGQLLYSSEIEGIDARDRLRFWRAYRGASRRSAGGRWLLRLILFKCGLYRRHNARRKTAVINAE